ncbi:MAG: restriction endonuclease subunit S, partial [Thermoanaerobaculia bacterium]
MNLSTLKPLNSLSLEPLKEGWKWVRLGEVLLTNPQYGLTATAENSEKDYIYIRITDITDEGKLKIEDLRFIDLDKEIFEKYKVFENDILIARSGSVGRIYLVKESDLPKPAVFASYLIRFKLNPNVVLPEYFFYFGLSEQYKNFILEQIKTVAQPNINAKQYQNIQFSLPPLPEQRRIVEKLKGIMEEIEKARSACEKELEAVKALPSAYLREVFESEEVKKWERR